jgi:hypothetical protein
MTQVSLPPGALALWRELLGLPAQDGFSPWPGHAAWLATLSPGLVADLAPHHVLDAETVQATRLMGRYQQGRQLQALRWIAEAGLACVTLKGFATGFLYYPRPASRLLGDLDLLVREEELPALVRALCQHGFRFGAAERTVWGFLSDASFVPFHSADGDCNIDLHVKPDSYPLSLGLSTEDVFAQARQIMAGPQLVSVPSAPHLALILIANFAKDKFAPSGLRKLLDLGRLLRHEHEFAWSELIERAGKARLRKALETSVALLRGLGTPDEWLPANLGRGRSAVIDRLLQDWCRQTPPSLWRRLEREWRLSAEPGVAARLAFLRIRGLIRPRSGMPQELDG